MQGCVSVGLEAPPESVRIVAAGRVEAAGSIDKAFSPLRVMPIRRVFGVKVQLEPVPTQLVCGVGVPEAKVSDGKTSSVDSVYVRFRPWWLSRASTCYAAKGPHPSPIFYGYWLAEPTKPSI